jgi:hypothetical protein
MSVNGVDGVHERDDILSGEAQRQLSNGSMHLMREAIRGHQRPSEVIRVHQSSSELIRAP